MRRFHCCWTVCLLLSWSATLVAGEHELRILDGRVKQDGNVREEDLQASPIKADRVTPIGGNLLEVEKSLTPPPPRVFSAFKESEQVYWPFPRQRPPRHIDAHVEPGGIMLFEDAAAIPAAWPTASAELTNIQQPAC